MVALRLEMRRCAQRAGLGRFPGGAPLMATLAQEPGITLNELARQVGLAKSQVSAMVSHLAAEGAVSKLPDPIDRRLVRIHLTDEGRHRLERWRAAYRSLLIWTLQSLSEEVAADLIRGLEALDGALGRGAPEVRENGVRRP